jgi:hypothetical protein
VRIVTTQPIKQDYKTQEGSYAGNLKNRNANIGTWKSKQRLHQMGVLKDSNIAEIIHTKVIIFKEICSVYFNAKKL